MLVHFSREDGSVDCEPPSAQNTQAHDFSDTSIDKFVCAKRHMDSRSGRSHRPHRKITLERCEKIETGLTRIAVSPVDAEAVPRHQLAPVPQQKGQAYLRKPAESLLAWPSDKQ